MNENQFLTVFLINWGEFPFYFKDNIECLSLCWAFLEESKGKKSYLKSSTGISWYMIREGNILPFSPDVLESNSKSLYEQWLHYFKGLKKIDGTWFLNLNIFYLFKNIPFEMDSVFFKNYRGLYSI